jgi:hypothetical protein
MTRKDFRLIYGETSKSFYHSVGFDGNGIKYIFKLDAHDSEFGLIIREDKSADMAGPTLLYNPKQIQRGLYQLHVERLERLAGKGCFPTLANNGKMAK